MCQSNMGEYTAEEIGRALELLAESDRREIIRILRESEADHVQTREIITHLQESDPTRNEEDRIAIAVHHNHLPKLAETDVVDFDSDSETIRYNDDELVETLLESISEIQTSTP